MGRLSHHSVYMYYYKSGIKVHASIELFFGGPGGVCMLTMLHLVHASKSCTIMSLNMLFVTRDIVHYMKWDSGGNYIQQLDV